MLDERAVLCLVPGERGLHIAVLRQHLSRFAVVIQIHQEGELDGEAAIDLVLLPLATTFSRILHPPQTLGKPGAAHDVHVAVAVDIERQVAEVVDVAVVVCKGAEFVLHPVRGLVPILTGYDVELAIAVDIGEGAGLVRAEIDLVLAEGDFVRTADGPGDRGQERERREDVTDHAHDCISFDADRSAFA